MLYGLVPITVRGRVRTPGRSALRLDHTLQFVAAGIRCSTEDLELFAELQAFGQMAHLYIDCGPCAIIESDYAGHEACWDLQVRTVPDIVRTTGESPARLAELLEARLAEGPAFDLAYLLAQGDDQVEQAMADHYVSVILEQAQTEVPSIFLTDDHWDVGAIAAADAQISAAAPTSRLKVMHQMFETYCVSKTLTALQEDDRDGDH